MAITLNLQPVQLSKVDTTLQITSTAGAVLRDLIQQRLGRVASKERACERQDVQLGCFQQSYGGKWKAYQTGEEGNDEDGAREKSTLRKSAPLRNYAWLVKCATSRLDLSNHS